MAKSNDNLQNFVTSIRSQSTPRADRFEVDFNIPSGLEGSPDFVRTLSLRCEEAQIPGLAATNLPVKIGPWTEYRTQNVEFLSTDLSFTFIVDELWSGRELFEDWIALAASPVNKEVSFYKDYVADITVKSLSVNDDVLAAWKLIEATPKLINLTPVSWGSNGFLRMSVSFSAKKWVRDYSDVGIDAIGEEASFTNEQKASAFMNALAGKSDFFQKNEKN